MTKLEELARRILWRVTGNTLFNVDGSDIAPIVVELRAALKPLLDAAEELLHMEEWGFDPKDIEAAEAAMREQVSQWRLP